MEARRAHRGEPPFFTTNLGARSVYDVRPNQSLPNGLTTVTSEPPGNPMTYHWEVFGTAVPEPATGELLGIACIGLFLKRKGRTTNIDIRMTVLRS